MTLRRLEDNKIAKKIPLSKIRRNGIRLNISTMLAKNYDDEDEEYRVGRRRGDGEPFALKTRGEL